MTAQSSSNGVAAVRILDIRLTTAAFGLPAGARVEVGVAVATLEA